MAPKKKGAKDVAAARPPRPLPAHVQAAADRLATAAAVLAGFHRRHKNQHRVSTYWWPAFGQLRRHVRRLGDDITGLRHSRDVDEEKKKIAVEARARWLRSEFVPKAYLAFSRLVADKQFAAQGLLLLGVLAQVHAALGPLAGEDVREGNPAKGVAVAAGDDDDDDDETIMLEHGQFRGPIEADNEAEGDDELGVAVAREEEDVDEMQTDEEGDEQAAGEPAFERHKGDIGNTAATTAPATKQPPRGEPRGKESSARKSRRVDAAGATRAVKNASTAGDTAASIVRAVAEAVEEDEEASRKENDAPDTADIMELEKREKKDKKGKRDKKDKKTKKRKRAGDEFDDLFSGLL